MSAVFTLDNTIDLMHRPLDAPLRVREMERQRSHAEFMTFLQSDEFRKLAEDVARNVGINILPTRGLGDLADFALARAYGWVPPVEDLIVRPAPTVVPLPGSKIAAFDAEYAALPRGPFGRVPRGSLKRLCAKYDLDYLKVKSQMYARLSRRAGR